MTFLLFSNDLQVLWKAFIDFEIEQGENDRVRQLYKILLERTNHIKVRFIAIILFDNARLSFSGLGQLDGV